MDFKFHSNFYFKINFLAMNTKIFFIFVWHIVNFKFFWIKNLEF